MNKTFHIITLGCKLNKYESDCMANLLIEKGYKYITNFEFADIYIINTCAVTKESEKKSRQYISKCLKLNPNAKIIICGCASENNLEQFKNKTNVFSVIGNEKKDQIDKFIESSVFKVYDFLPNYNNLKNPNINQTRAYLKVQDGCNNFCAYCLIPYLRGRSRSRELTECVKEAEFLSKTCKELVLTGIDLSSYQPSLIELIEKLSHLTCRVRLGSLEQKIITEEFMQRLQKVKNFCPHFHLSLQSGDDAVLKRMNRHYTAQQYYEKVDLIRKYFPLANITTDIIVGFAGETEQEFLNTKSFVEKVNFGAVHVFPFSMREGTLASKIYKDTVNSEEKNKRVKLLQQVAKISGLNYINKIKNVEHKVLTEDHENDFVVGYTESYIKVYLPKQTALNQILTVKITGEYLDGVKGEIINNEVK